MICCVCGDWHHALSCPIARSTLLAAFEVPGDPPAPERQLAARTIQDRWVVRHVETEPVPVHDAVVKEGQRLWNGRRYPTPKLGIARSESKFRDAG